LVQTGFAEGLLVFAGVWMVITVLVAALIGALTAIVNSSASYALVLV